MGGGRESEENVLSACDRANTGLWRIERDERFGRYMVATRDILPGQLILAEEPIMWGPNTTNRNLVCLGCFRFFQQNCKVSQIQMQQYPPNHSNTNTYFFSDIFRSCCYWENYGGVEKDKSLPGLISAHWFRGLDISQLCWRKLFRLKWWSLDKMGLLKITAR